MPDEYYYLMIIVSIATVMSSAMSIIASVVTVRSRNKSESKGSKHHRK